MFAPPPPNIFIGGGGALPPRIDASGTSHSRVHKVACLLSSPYGIMVAMYWYQGLIRDY